MGSLTWGEIAAIVAPTIVFLVNTANNFWGNWLQRRQAIALEESNRLAKPQLTAEREFIPVAPPVESVATTGLLRVDLKSIGVMAIMMLLSWAAVAYELYEQHQASPPVGISGSAVAIPGPPPVTGSVDIVGGAQDIKVLINMDMPYEAFCTTDWGSLCHAKEKQDRLMVLAFNDSAPHDGGKAQWQVTPTPLLKAYHQEVDTVEDRNKTIGDLQAQIRQLKAGALHAASRIEALESYKQKVNSTIDHFEANADKSFKQIKQNEDLLVSSTIPGLEGAQKNFADFNDSLPRKKGQAEKMCKEWLARQVVKPQPTGYYSQSACVDRELNEILAPPSQKQQLEADVDSRKGDIGTNEGSIEQPFNDCRQTLKSLRSM